MSEIKNPGAHSEEEFNELANLISDALDKGDTREEILADLVNNGWEQKAAHELVGAVERAKYSQSTGASNGGGLSWMIGPGALILFNVCSYLFDWGFWLF